MMEVRKKSIKFADESGIGLVETLISIAIIGIAVTFLVVSLSTGSLAVQRNDKRVTAENLARSQMEYTKQQVYGASYGTLTPVPSGYAIVTDASDRDNNMQKITVTVNYDGDTLFSLEGYKVDR